MIDLTTCPECGAVAEVRDRAALQSTEGPVEHVKVACVRRHWYLLPVDRLAPSGAPHQEAGSSGAVGLAARAQ